MDTKYGLFGPSKKEKALTERINRMRSRIGTGLGNESLSFYEKIKALTKERNSMRSSLFNDNESSVEEDNYMAGSPGMSSVGSIGGNTNRGLTPLNESHHRDSIEKIKKHLRNERAPKPQKQEDMYSKNIMKNSFSGLEKPQSNKLFKNTPPKGLAEKVRKHMESLKK